MAGPRPWRRHHGYRFHPPYGGPRFVTGIEVSTGLTYGGGFPCPEAPGAHPASGSDGIQPRRLRIRLASTTCTQQWRRWLMEGSLQINMRSPTQWWNHGARYRRHAG